MTLLRKWTSTSLVLRIIIGLAIGIILGLTIPEATGISILGTLFVGALKAIAPILVAILVMSSVANAKENLGSRFKTVITLYILSTLIAAMVAVAGSFMFPITITLQEATTESTQQGLGDILQSLFTNAVANPIKSISEASYLAILFWAIIIGFAMKRIASDTTKRMVTDFADAISMVVRWVIQFAPFGITGLVFTAVSESGLSIFTEYGQLILLLVGCMLFTAFVTNPLQAWLVIRRNPYKILWQCVKESGLSAFFTRSSAANIPVNMDLCQRMGVDKNFYSVSIPLGSTINMNGAAVTITVFVLALCHTKGIDISLVSAILLSCIATLGACGASGIPGGSLLLIPMACSLFEINNDIAMQAVAVGFIIGVVQDSFETALNSSGDAFFTIIADIRDKTTSRHDI